MASVLMLSRALADACLDRDSTESNRRQVKALEAKRKQLTYAGIETRDLGAVQRRLGDDIVRATRKVRRGEEAWNVIARRPRN